MTDLDRESAATHAVELLKHYGFDLGGYAAEALVHHWSRDYPVTWLRSAVIEALYQGRYKAVSVEQILTLWRRREHPIHHFNHEFERIICNQFPSYRGILTALPDSSRTTSPVSEANPSNSEEIGSFTENQGVTPSTEVTAESTVGVPPASTSGHDTAPRLPVLNSIREVLPSSEERPAHMVESISEVRQGELPIQPFKPRASLEPVVVDRRAGWSRTDAVKHPIHQFIPTEESSEFYSKLKAVVQQHEATDDAPGSLALTTDRQARQLRQSPEP